MNDKEPNPYMVISGIIVGVFGVMYLVGVIGNLFLRLIGKQ